MNITSYVSAVTSQFSHVPPSAYPALAWSYYIQHLWNYEANSWVATIAYSCRVLATLLSLPIVILGLLDISSYVIARTLGVVDDVKASTSDNATGVQAPTTLVEASDSDRDSLEGITHLVADSSDSLGVGLAPRQPKEFFATEKNLKLSGVDIFSPAPTRPSSPGLTRKNASCFGKDDGDSTLRQRQSQLKANGH